jgi:hypothetical protein
MNFAKLHNAAFTTPISRSPFSERLFSSISLSQKTCGLTGFVGSYPLLVI